MHFLGFGIFGIHLVRNVKNGFSTMQTNALLNFYNFSCIMCLRELRALSNSMCLDLQSGIYLLRYEGGESAFFGFWDFRHTSGQEWQKWVFDHAI